MTTYHSKIGWGLAAFLYSILIGTLTMMLTTENWVGAAIVGAVLALVLHLYLTTRYVIQGDLLMVRSSFLYKEDVAIHAIAHVAPTGNPLSSPALSLDRLAITHHAGQVVLISPKAKAEFVAHLLRINPDIEVEGM